jgi:hypothetical protein
MRYLLLFSTLLSIAAIADEGMWQLYPVSTYGTDIALV